MTVHAFVDESERSRRHAPPGLTRKEKHSDYYP